MGPNQYRDRRFNHFLAVSQENRSLLRGVDELFTCGPPLNKSPFVRVELGSDIVSALWDSGSDLSLIAADKVKDLAELQPIEFGESPQAVEGSVITFKGKLP